MLICFLASHDVGESGEVLAVRFSRRCRAALSRQLEAEAQESRLPDDPGRAE